MKELSLEKMSTIEGGIGIPSIDSICQASAVGQAINEGLTPGSDIWVIFTNLAYSGCWESYIQ